MFANNVIKFFLQNKNVDLNDFHLILSLIP